MLYLPADVKALILAELTRGPAMWLEGKERAKLVHQIARDCFSLQLVDCWWRRAVDAHCAQLWPLVYMWHAAHNGECAIDKTLQSPKYRSAMYCRVEERHCLEEIHRTLVEQRVVYRTKTGRLGDHTKLGFKKLPALAAKLKSGRAQYKQRCKDYKRLHERS